MTICFEGQSSRFQSADTNVTVEYKLEIPQEREKYLKSAVAFANGAGGRLIFGVKIRRGM